MIRLTADLDRAILLKLHPRRQEAMGESLMFDSRGKNPAACSLWAACATCTGNTPNGAPQGP